MTIPSLLAAVALAPIAPPAPPASAPPEPPAWAAAEAPFLTGHVQLTFPDRFLKAGEAYFDHASPPAHIVFQAIEVPAPGAAASTDYAIYVAPLLYDRGEITGLGTPVLVSPPGSANTCAWFHPADPNRLLFASTLAAPQAADPPGYSRDRQQYSWKFPPEMRVVEIRAPRGWDGPISPVALLFEPPGGPGYTAECSWSPDGRHILYTYLDPATKSPDLWVFDTRSSTHTPLVQAPGYDGGPFFSPDGRRIIHRADRRGDNNLQVKLAALAFADPADPARITGITSEIALTDDKHVNWAPFWHPSGNYVAMATSREGHQNYEVYALETPATAAAAAPRAARITHAPGFDGLPAFSADARWMMWTSQRGPKLAREQRPSSQLWIARASTTPPFPPCE